MAKLNRAAAPDAISPALPVTALGLTGYLFIGTAAVLIPSVMPFITDEYMATGLTLTAIGLIFPARAVGGILGNLLAGVSSDRLGYGKLVWIAALAVAFSMALTAAARAWFLFLAGFALISIVQASLTTGINAMVADANRDSRARALNVLHGVYAVGATISPLVFAVVLEQGVPWRWTMAATGLIWLFYGAGALLLVRRISPSTASSAGQAAPAVDESVHAQDPGQKKTRQGGVLASIFSSVWVELQDALTANLGMLRNAGFLSLFLIAFIYNGVAFSLLGWVALFMQESAGFSTFSSISMISVFYIALTAGRFLCAAYAERLGYAATLLILAAGLALTYPLVIFSTTAAPLVIGIFLTGLTLSGLFPTALAYGTRLYPQHSGAVTGVLNVAMTIGTMLPPLWTAIFSDLWSFQTALGINYSMALLLLAVCVYLTRIEPRTKS
ncbi:MAG: MFS transporter [Caldilineaceae bacterium SB0670_bin_27]|uniref:MFS transporter n=1 Tax=Caldilineaceae bacterium SB0664_bin_27 TaxID=2605260 RepID=A0A6B0YTZ8_9CHLR|nr:MFS transporter [Caldilineaceae bacterium SB0664_bin_27]MYJ78742.1 MFS transporter [Caldilineaceae bacterium SB0670_bin_27]